MPSDRPAGAPALLVSRAVRRRAHEVAIGNVTVGGRYPIAIQSMTTTRTADAAATAAQVAALARAGCAIVRVTVPSKPDAEALPEIRRLLAQEGVTVPLVADIHFTPNLALAVVDLVEKVRVNPGNFADRKSLKGEAYDDARWDQDVQRLYELFAPLVDRARERGVALRIGTNHGSLSDRIVHRFGDSPLGMVESALEFVRIAEDRGFDRIVISMKASNPQVMVRAYRLLVDRLDREHRPYPLHLGVTEAGGGDEGRIKSSAGIATLLADGLGDTVRVSLTEDPVNEVPVARELVRQFGLGGTLPAAVVETSGSARARRESAGRGRGDEGSARPGASRRGADRSRSDGLRRRRSAARRAGRSGRGRARGGGPAGAAAAGRGGRRAGGGCRRARRRRRLPRAVPGGGRDALAHAGERAGPRCGVRAPRGVGLPGRPAHARGR